MRAGSADTSISERQDTGLAGNDAQLCMGMLAESRAATPGQASIIEAVAAAEKQAAGSGDKQGMQTNVLYHSACLVPCLLG